MPAPLDGERVEIVVRDGGMGLSPDELADVRRFVPGGTSKKRYGTGFGLAIAKRKVEDHGGGLTIDSLEDVGTGPTAAPNLQVELACPVRMSSLGPYARYARTATGACRRRVWLRENHREA